MNIKMHSELVKILECPISGGKLYYDDLNKELICFESGLAYKVKDGIPLLLKEKARTLPEQEIKLLMEQLGVQLEVC